MRAGSWHQLHKMASWPPPREREREGGRETVNHKCFNYSIHSLKCGRLPWRQLYCWDQHLTQWHCCWIVQSWTLTLTGYHSPILHTVHKNIKNLQICEISLTSETLTNPESLRAEGSFDRGRSPAILPMYMYWFSNWDTPQLTINSALSFKIIDLMKQLNRAIPLVETGSIKRRDPDGLRSRASSSRRLVEWEREEGGTNPERMVSKEEVGWPANEKERERTLRCIQCHNMRLHTHTHTHLCWVVAHAPVRQSHHFPPSPSVPPPRAVKHQGNGRHATPTEPSFLSPTPQKHSSLALKLESTSQQDLTTITY